MPDTFCQLPWTYLHLSGDGVSPCCRAKLLISAESLKSGFYQSAPFSELREKLSSGIQVPECTACWEDESNGRISLRQRFGVEAFNKFNIDFSEEPSPIVVEILLDRICPLSCRMCNSNYSNSWDRVFDFFEDNRPGFSKEVWSEIEEKNRKPTLGKSRELLTDKPRFWETLRDSCQSATIINLTGGEPLAHPGHMKLLEEVRSQGVCNLSYFTSLAVSDSVIEKCAAHWGDFSSVLLNVSADHIGPQYDRFRMGANFSNLVRRIEKLMNLGIKIKIPVILQAFNVEDIDQILMFWKEREVDVELKSLTGPTFLSTTVIPIEKRPEIIAKLESFLLKEQRTPIREALLSEIKQLSSVDDSSLYQDYLLFNESLDEYQSSMRS